MAKERKYDYYIVETFNNKTNSRFIYHEDGYNVQEVVNRAKCYIADEEEIIGVYKQIRGWK